MILTEKQKQLLFYALAGIERTLYYDDELEQIDYNYNNFQLDVYAINEITSNLNELEKLIDKTLSDLC